MRSARQSEGFPYEAKTTCYVQVDNYGKVTQVHHNNTELTAAYKKARDGECTLYAVWPGRYSSDLFIIDDLNTFADAFGIFRGDDHVHDIEWKVSEIDDGRSHCAWVNVRFRCNCALDKLGIRKFANDMRAQKGWDIAVSKGYSMHYDSSGTEYIVPVRRSSLK